MQDTIACLFSGHDKPGLIESIATVLADHRANWLESDITHVSGMIAGILYARVDADQMQPLRDGLLALRSPNLNLSVEAHVQYRHEPNVRHIAIEVTGPDQPGIVLEITRALNRSKLNIDEMHTTYRCPYQRAP